MDCMDRMESTDTTSAAGGVLAGRRVSSNLQFARLGLALLALLAPGDSRAQSPDSPAPRPARVLEFPDRDMGMLMIRDVASENPRDWERISDARGRVEIPAGKEVAWYIDGYAARDDLSFIAALPPDAIHEINLNWREIPDAQLANVARLTGLEILYLGIAPKVTDAGLRELAPLKKLRVLDLRMVEITDAGLVALADLPALEELSLHQTKITDAGLANLAGCKSLRKLGLWYSMVGDAGMVHLANLPRLESVDFPGSIGDPGIAELVKIPTLRELLFHANGGISDRGMEMLATLPNLETLYVSSDRVTDQGLMALARSAAPLDTIYLNRTRATQTGFRTLKERRPGRVVIH